jgi:hypothetical protein
MPSFDSIVVGEDWISEHYFTTDSPKESFQSEVLKLRKQWDEQAKEGHESVLKRFLSGRGTFQVELAELLEAPSKASATYHKVREALGFKGTTADLTAVRAGTMVRVPNVWKSDNGDVLFLESHPVESVEDLLDSAKANAKMLAPTFIDDKEAELSAPKLVSELYRTDEPPQFIVVFGGRWLLLTERERWAEGRYLAADLLLACERNDTKRGGEIDRVLAIFGRESLLPDASESIWWNQILENSVKHTIGVSKDLREGIRLSIEIIANDVLRRRQAQGLALDEVDGQILARQSLRYLYRILFLLYAEASPEMGVLPVGAGEYSVGYGLDRLRELTLTPLNSPQGRLGTHFYQSLNTLFFLVDQGHHPRVSVVERVATPDAAGLHFHSLKADLFDPKAMIEIDRVGLSNVALQKVLQHLLLSKEVKGKDRGFISYAELGVNQLGAVYEGLMSYTGIIAESDLYEVAKEGDSSKGSWVVPVERSESIQRKHFVVTANELTGEPEPVLHEKRTFVFRLAGRERQQSASYYTAEVLTRFVVAQALEELLDQDGNKTAADEILNLTVCEPALGSGAFAIEAVRQLADEYLKRKQRELDEQIPAEDYAVELQKVKAQIALHQVYGVDLNSTAVELAEVSLWLDTMVAGLQAPWFGLHLRRGNSLIGARRATYSRAAVNDKSWLTNAPADAPLSGLADAMAGESDDPNVIGRIHHFLLPGAGWGAAAEAKEVKALASDAQKELRAWRNRVKTKPSKAQVERLLNLGRRVESLWKFALRRLEVAESEARRPVDYFGKREATESDANPVSREEIEEKLTDPNGATQRLRRVMDAWNALWFWPLTETATHGIKPPTLEDWITGLESILGFQAKDPKMVGQRSLLAGASWDELNEAEDLELSFAGVSEISQAVRTNAWLQVCQDISADQGFFHWELDFASVLARGGFDLQVGNPPWVRPDWDERAMMAEHDPWWQLASKATQHEKNSRRSAAYSDPTQVEFLCSQAANLVATRGFLTDAAAYPIVNGLRPDLYRSFMERTWRSSSAAGVVGLIHPESHFTETKAARLRGECYRRLRRHWHFVNELVLFEISNHVTFGVHVYGRRGEQPGFVMAASLYHPDTVARSMVHDGSGDVPGLKDPAGNWDLRPHRERIIHVNEEVLGVWAEILDEPGTSALHARMIYPVNVDSSRVLEKLSKAPRVRELSLEYSSGWNETTDRKNGYFEVGSAVPESWADVVLQGPHFTVATPFAKQPNPTMKSNKDWTEVDLETLPGDYIPRTSYQPTKNAAFFQSGLRRWNQEQKLETSFYRVAWREMAATTGARTLHSTILPPGPSHLYTVYAYGAKSSSKSDLEQLALVGGVFSSVLADFLVKVSGNGHIPTTMTGQIPYQPDHVLSRHLVERTLRLNCLTPAYATIWELVMGRPWNENVPLRRAEVRRAALVDIDAIYAIMLGVSADELCSIYKTQFPVMQGYERSDLYDVNGRKVPPEITKLFRQLGMNLGQEERTASNTAGNVYTYEFPFVSFDRETDMRQAHAHFTKLMEEMN